MSDTVTRTGESVLGTVIFLVGLLAGGAFENWKRDNVKDDLASLKVTNAEAHAATDAAALARFQVAAARSDQLEKKLHDTEDQLHQLSEEKRRAVKPLTTGRTCLTAAAVRVLNADTRNAPGGVPAAIVGSAPADAAASTDPDVDGEEEATDADVAGWAIIAKEQYGVCRQRLQNLIDWFPPLHAPSPTPTVK